MKRAKALITCCVIVVIIGGYNLINVTTCVGKKAATTKEAATKVTTTKAVTKKVKKTENKEARQIIWVGDSRSAYIKKNITIPKNVTIIAKTGKGYKWFKEEAEAEVAKVRKDGDTIVLWLGVNDYRSPSLGGEPYQVYADEYTRLIENEWKKNKVYVVSVGYVDMEKIYQYYGKYNRANSSRLPGQIRVNGIRGFNTSLKKELPDSIDWIDITDVVGISAKDNIRASKSDFLKRKNKKYDGLHYSTSKSREIFNYVLGQMNLSMYH